MHHALADASADKLARPWAIVFIFADDFTFAHHSFDVDRLESAFVERFNACTLIPMVAHSILPAQYTRAVGGTTSTSSVSV